MTFNTHNPLGSVDDRDVQDNAENMDYLENSTTELTHPDRLGTVRKTRHGMEVEHDAQIAAHESEHDAQMQSFENDFDGRLAGMAFTRVGSFTTGATLIDVRQVLVWEASQGGDGHEYSWAGTFPKVVAAGATPATSGGIGAGAWVDRSGFELRSDLAAVTGASLVNTSTGETVEDRLSDIDSSLSGKADLAGSASQTFSVADATDPHHAVSYEQYLTTPTDTIAGIARRATDNEEIAGTSDVGFLTPLGLRNALNATGSAPVFALRAWASFRQVGTQAINASGNILSITDVAVGRSTFTFSTAMRDVDYAVLGLPATGAGATIGVYTASQTAKPTTKLAGSCQIVVADSSVTLVDIYDAYVSFVR